MQTSLGERFSHSPLRGGLCAPFLWGAVFWVLLGACRQGEAGEGGGAVAAGAWPPDASPNMSSLANNSLIRVGNLKPRQLVLTIDESPFYSWTDKLAESLMSGRIKHTWGKPISAVFFVVANKVMDDVNAVASGAASELSRSFSLPGDGGTLITINVVRPKYAPQRLDAIIANGHYVANHSFSHPIAGHPSAFDTTGLGFDGLFRRGGPDGRNKTVNEVVWTHQVIQEALTRSNRSGDKYLRWFRPPGGGVGIRESRRVH